MRKKNYYILAIIMIHASLLFNAQNISTLNQKKNFVEQFFMNQNVYRTLKNYTQKDIINIIDPDHYMTDEVLVYDNKGLKISISNEKKDEFDFYIKKTIINKDLAFVVLWYKDTTTALCFYPFKSEYSSNRWLIEEITKKSIK